MLGREFAKILRTALNSFYGKAQKIRFLIGDVHFIIDLTLVGEEYEKETFGN
jgi:predicted nuclease with TOPRIM domain